EGAAEKQGFDQFYGYYDQVHAHEYFPKDLTRNGKREILPGNADGKRGQYSHDLILAEMLRFLDANHKSPFFAYGCWTFPHRDFESREIAAKSRDMGWPAPVKNVASRLRRLDDGVGQVLAKLKDLGVDRNTLVIFTSDNGAQHPGRTVWNSTAGLRGFKR